VNFTFAFIIIIIIIIITIIIGGGSSSSSSKRDSSSSSGNPFEHGSLLPDSQRFVLNPRLSSASLLTVVNYI